MISEAELIKENQRLNKEISELKELTNSIENGLICCDLSENQKVIYGNHGFFKLIGYNKKQFLEEQNNSFSSIIHYEDIAETFKEMKRQVLEKGRGEQVFRIITRDQKRLWVLAKGTLIKTKDNGMRFYMALIDNTKELRIKKLLIEKNKELLITKKRYETVIENSDLMMFDYFAKEGKIVFSKAMMNKLGISKPIKNGIEGMIENGLIHSKSINALREMEHKLKSGVSGTEGIIIFLDKNNNESTQEVFIRNVLDKKGDLLFAVGIMRDLSEQRALTIEKGFINLMAKNKIFVYEANISQNKIIFVNRKWAGNLELPPMEKFSDLVAYVAEHYILADDTSEFTKMYSSENIKRCWEREEKIQSIIYQRRMPKDNFIWVQNSINIIKDEFTGDMKVRCYLDDITEEKEKEAQIRSKQKYYEAFLPEDCVRYEVNVSKNVFINGHEKWPEMFGIEFSNDYGEMVEAISKNVVFPEDREAYEQKFLRDHILKAYYSGYRDIYCEYRRLGPDGEYIWVACSVYLVEDPLTKDIEGFAYVQDIDVEKKKQLALIFKSEHDGLTGLYNKVTAETMIEEYLTSKEGNQGNHALFVIDVDYFKQINDQFGHVFGDTVLSEVGRKIKALFRKEDIVGRIGGDEFIVFMKDIHGQSVVLSKAEQLCEGLREAFTKNDQTYQISGSVGVSIFPQHGRNYMVLFSNADRALYVAKESGKNGYISYNTKMAKETKEARGEETELSYIESKTFSENVSGYIFKILYEAKKKEDGINGVLEIVGKYFKVSRVFVYEKSKDGASLKNTFEWCEEKTAPEIKDPPYALLENFGLLEENRFDEDGLYFLRKKEEMKYEERFFLEKKGIKSLLLCSINENGCYSGFIGFEQREFSRKISKKEATDLKEVSSILGVFIRELRLNEIYGMAQNTTISLADALDSDAYIIDPETYQILFFNKRALRFSTKVRTGEVCFEVLWGRKRTCRLCPMRKLKESDGEEGPCVLERKDSKTGKWTKSIASWVEWTDGRKCCLIESVDITKYMENIEKNESLC